MKPIFLILVAAISSAHAEPLVKGTPKDVDASVYSPALEGEETATGEVYKPEEETAAHKTLPLGSEVKMKDKESGKETQVRINDRGPYVKGREFDLSKKAAQDLGMDKGKGVKRLEAQVVKTPDGRSGSPKR